MLQATVCLLLLATLGLVTMEECLRAVNGSSHGALVGHGVLDQLRTEFHRSAPALQAQRGAGVPEHDIGTPEGVLALVWPQYLQTAAASRDPVTQVHARCCRSITAA